MQRAANDLVGNVRSIEIAGVNVIHAGGYRFAQHSDGGIGIARWSPDPGPASCIAPYPRRCTVIEVPRNVKLPPRLVVSNG